MPYPTKADKELVQAFSQLKTERETTGFLRDLLTPAEIEEFARRFQIAKLLWTTRLSYLQIADKAETSTTTVTRVSQWLYRENWGGYSVVLQRLYGKSLR